MNAAARPEVTGRGSALGHEDPGLSAGTPRGPPTLEVFLRLDDVKRATGLGKSTIYDLQNEGRFPRPVKINGGRAVAWLGSEIAAWQAQRIAERDQSIGSRS